MKGVMILKQTRADRKEKRQIASFSKRNVNTSVLLPFRQYKNDCFYMDDGGFVDFIKINCKDILSLSEDEKEIINYTFEKFYKTYSGDMKLIGINMPVDTTKNQSYMQHKLVNCKNSVQRRFLLEELEYEKTAQEMITQREFYLCFFFDSLEQRKDALNECISILGEQSLAEQLTQQEKETIIYQLCNKNVPVDIDQLHSIKLPRQEAIDKYVENVGFDPYLISRIQPRGGISFKDERYISTGTGYEACVHIYDYKINISDYWLNPILNIDNVISVMDISTENTDIVNKNLNKSLDEQESRYGSTDKSGEKLEAKNRYEELESLHFEINNMEEIIKLIHIRLFVSSLTKNELEKKIAGIIGKLNGKGFKGAVFLGENDNEWKSMFQSYTKQQISKEYARYGQVVTSHQLASGNPCIFSSLNDPYGHYMGTTINSLGIFNFDLWAATSFRTHYNLLVAGAMGAGKSTFLKNLLTIQFAQGNYIRAFDVKDEYEDFVNELGGKMIYLDGSKGMLNLLEIFATDSSEIRSYTKHISKLRVIYKLFKRSATDNELSLFTDMLNLLYFNFNLRGDNAKKTTGLKPESYPTFSDLLKLIEKELNNTTTNGADKVQQSIEIEKKRILLSVYNTIKEIVESFGTIFDGHTTIENILDEQVVFFNVAKLKNLDDAVFAAQLYNILMLIWDNCNKIQTPIKNAFADGKITLADVTRYLIVMDESAKLINAKNEFALEPIASFMREDRWLFASFLFATQKTSDYIPVGSSAKGIEQLQNLFELCQYKFIMKQDSTTLPLLNQIFKEQMTESEISQIPHFEKGQGIMSISGDKNILVNIDVSDERLKFFKGGV